MKLKELLPAFVSMRKRGCVYRVVDRADNDAGNHELTVVNTLLRFVDLMQSHDDENDNTHELQTMALTLTLFSADTLDTIKKTFYNPDEWLQYFKDKTKSFHASVILNKSVFVISPVTIMLQEHIMNMLHRANSFYVVKEHGRLFNFNLPRTNVSVSHQLEDLRHNEPVTWMQLVKFWSVRSFVDGPAPFLSITKAIAKHSEFSGVVWERLHVPNWTQIYDAIFNLEEKAMKIFFLFWKDKNHFVSAFIDTSISKKHLYAHDSMSSRNAPALAKETLLTKVQAALSNEHDPESKNKLLELLEFFRRPELVVPLCTLSTSVCDAAFFAPPQRPHSNDCFVACMAVWLQLAFPAHRVILKRIWNDGFGGWFFRGLCIQTITQGKFSLPTLASVIEFETLLTTAPDNLRELYNPPTVVLVLDDLDDLDEAASTQNSFLRVSESVASVDGKDRDDSDHDGDEDIGGDMNSQFGPLGGIDARRARITEVYTLRQGVEAEDNEDEPIDMEQAMKELDDIVDTELLASLLVPIPTLQPTKLCNLVAATCDMLDLGVPREGAIEPGTEEEEQQQHQQPQQEQQQEQEQQQQQQQQADGFCIDCKCVHLPGPLCPRCNLSHEMPCIWSGIDDDLKVVLMSPAVKFKDAVKPLMQAVQKEFLLRSSNKAYVSYKDKKILFYCAEHDRVKNAGRTEAVENGL